MTDDQIITLLKVVRSLALIEYPYPPGTTNEQELVMLLGAIAGMIDRYLEKKEAVSIPGDETAAIARAIGEALFGYFDPDEDGPSSPSQQARLAARAVIELLERARAKAD